VIEAERKRAVDGERAAEPHAAEHRKFAAPLQQKADELEEILVPAHGDAVLGDPAESGHHASIERLMQLGRVADRAEGGARPVDLHARNIRVERLDLESVHRNHGVTVVDEVVRERKARGSESHDQDLAAGRGLRHRPAQVERIPPREQAINFEAPGQRQNLLEDSRLDLGDVDRLLLLINAGLHAIIADAMAGGRAHRIIECDDGERTDRMAAGLDQIHLGDFLVERAARQRDAEDAFLELAALLPEPLRAGILALVVTPDAVVGVIERAGEIGARIGQRETVARAAM
jgi:hypothetical protein